MQLKTWTVFLKELDTSAMKCKILDYTAIKIKFGLNCKKVKVKLVKNVNLKTT